MGRSCPCPNEARPLGLLTRCVSPVVWRFENGSNRAHGDSAWGLFLLWSSVWTVATRWYPIPSRGTGAHWIQSMGLFSNVFARVFLLDTDLNVQHSTSSNVPRLTPTTRQRMESPNGPSALCPQLRTMAVGDGRFICQESDLITTASFQKGRGIAKRRFGRILIAQVEQLDVWGVNSVVRGLRGESGSGNLGLDAQWNDVQSQRRGRTSKRACLLRNGRVTPMGDRRWGLGGVGAARRSWGQRTFRSGVRC